MNQQYAALRDELRYAMRFGSRNEHQREAIWDRMDALVEELQSAAYAEGRQDEANERGDDGPYPPSNFACSRCGDIGCRQHP
jgi:hypothetical protein